MASDLVTFILEGEPTLDDLAAALPALKQILTGLAQYHVPHSSISWKIDDLLKGSAVISLLGEGDTVAVQIVAREYIQVGRYMRAGEYHNVLPPRARKGAQLLGELLDGRVSTLRFETMIDDVTIAAAHLPDALPDTERTWGAVEGRVQTLSSRNGLRFTLFDLLYDKGVFCYLDSDQQEAMMLGAWGQLARVTGEVQRDPRTGRPLNIRHISSVDLLQEGKVGDWRQAEGLLSGNKEPAEQTIRRLRDAG